MTRILLIAGFFLTSTAQGVEQHIQCPKRYPVHEARIEEVPEGWAGLGMVPAGMPLENAGAIDGPYSGVRAELRGSDQKTKDGSEHSFVFGQKEKWIYCGYGGTLELLHRVAPEASHCVIKYVRKKASDRPDINITCR